MLSKLEFISTFPNALNPPTKPTSPHKVTGGFGPSEKVS